MWNCLGIQLTEGVQCKPQHIGTKLDLCTTPPVLTSLCTTNEDLAHVRTGNWRGCYCLKCPRRGSNPNADSSAHVTPDYKLPTQDLCEIQTPCHEAAALLEQLRLESLLMKKRPSKPHCITFAFIGRRLLQLFWDYIVLHDLQVTIRGAI
jgi:hypothetical protein